MRAKAVRRRAAGTPRPNFFQRLFGIKRPPRRHHSNNRRRNTGRGKDFNPRWDEITKINFRSERNPLANL